MLSAYVQEHFANPRNLGVLEDADAVGLAGIPGQGPFMQMFLRMEGTKIALARFKLESRSFNMIPSRKIWCAAQILFHFTLSVYCMFANQCYNLMCGGSCTTMGSNSAYIVVDLGDLGGGRSEASDMNQASEVVGGSNNHSNAMFHAFYWKQGRMRQLNSGSYAYSTAMSVTEDDTIVGIIISLTDVLPVIWRGNQLHKLPLLPKCYGGTADGVNSSGIVVGTLSRKEPLGQIACMWQAGRAINLPVPKGNLVARARRINASGIIIGDFQVSVASGKAFQFVPRACLWKNGMFVDLMPGQRVLSQANGINDIGTIVGEIEKLPILGNHIHRAFLYKQGKIQILGVLPGDNYSVATAINNVGQIVGRSSNTKSESRTTRAFLWSNGRMVDLNALIQRASGWRLNDAVAINDHGEIAGTGMLHDTLHAFLLKPR